MAHGSVSTACGTNVGEEQLVKSRQRNTKCFDPGSRVSEYLLRLSSIENGRLLRA